MTFDYLFFALRKRRRKEGKNKKTKAQNKQF